MGTIFSDRSFFLTFPDRDLLQVLTLKHDCGRLLYNLSLVTLKSVKVNVSLKLCR